MIKCLPFLAMSVLVGGMIAYPTDPEEGLPGTISLMKKSLHVELLPGAPVLSDSWQEVDNPEFLLVREAPDKRSRTRRSSLGMESVTNHLVKRDPSYVGWTSVTNNMDVLRGHLREKLFVEVARRDGGGLGNIGKK